MGAASSSINRPDSSADHNDSSSSSKTAIPADSAKLDSPPDSSTPSMSDSASKTQSDTKPLEEEEAAKPKEDESEIGEEKEEEEEVGECGFCLFMKGGGCKETFTAWEKCIEEAEKTNEDIAQKCFEATSALKTCMLAHPDYYEPILRAEKAAEEEAVKELEKEKAAEKEEQDNKGQEKEKEKEKEKEVVIELENEKAPESSKTAPASSEDDSGGKQ